MSELLTVYVDGETIGDHLFANPDLMIEVMGQIAYRFSNADATLSYCKAVAGEHSGSLSDQMVAPFLDMLAGELRHEEAAMGVGA